METCDHIDGIRLLNRSCPLCGTAFGRFIGELTFKVFDDSPISGDCSLVTCPECGFAFHDTPSTQTDYDRYYSQHSYYLTSKGAGSGGLGKHDINRFEQLFERVYPLIRNRDAAIFDVGCAKGGLLGTFSAKGYSNLYGVDMQADCVEHAKSAYGVSAETGTALHLPFPGVKADVLILAHVAEHVIDLKQLAETARDKLNDDGILYVETPDASRYGEFSSNPYQDIYLEHVNHFDLKSLEALFSGNGFLPVQSGSYVLAASAANHVPCVWSIFRKGLREYKPDISLHQSLEKYITWSKSHFAYENFSKMTGTGSPLYLWGISQYAQLLLGQGALAVNGIRAFIDMDTSKRMRTLSGRKICSPEILTEAEPECVTLITAPGYENDIAVTLADLGFRGRAFSASGTELHYRNKDREL